MTSARRVAVTGVEESGVEQAGEGAGGKKRKYEYKKSKRRRKRIRERKSGMTQQWSVDLKAQGITQESGGEKRQSNEKGKKKTKRKESSSWRRGVLYITSTYSRERINVRPRTRRTQNSCCLRVLIETNNVTTKTNF